LYCSLLDIFGLGYSCFSILIKLYIYNAKTRFKTKKTEISWQSILTFC
jgi:hypothetical protein